MDLQPNDVDLEVADSFRRLLEAESPVSAVRAAEPLGHDPDLWKKVARIGVPGMLLADDGERAAILQVELASELFGSMLAPVPAVESLAAACALTSVDGGFQGACAAFGDDTVASIASGERIVGVALQDLGSCPVQLVLYGAVAEAIVGVDGDRVVLVERGDAHVRDVGPSHGSAGLARWDVRDARATSAASAWPAALATVWRAFGAGRLVGLASRSLEIAAEYAGQREAFGKRIGSFQGVAHPLADSASAVAGVRHLARKAAWLVDKGRFQEAELAARMGFAFAAETAMLTTTRCVHIHGGYGSALEYEIQLFHQRARAWGTAAGDPRADFARVGARLRRDGHSKES